MHRQLRELDRWYAAQEGTLSGPRGDLRRRFLVAGVTTLVAVLATGCLLQQEGYRLDRTGLHFRTGHGPVRSPGHGPYTFLAHQQGQPGVPVTYDGCKPIHVVVNDADAPPGADGILDEALASVTAATGLRFVRDGRTDEVPDPDRLQRDPARYGSGFSPVLVAWVTPKQVPGLAGRVVGLGGSTPRMNPTTGRLSYSTGTVSLDSPTAWQIMSRPEGRALVRAIVMHELGHVVGLDHVEDPGELMYDDNVGRTTWGPGDLTGLAVLGTGPCTG